MASLEDLIPVVNKLQDLVFNTIGSDALDLPQVVVVGSQSCGKSSVLENIVGRDFLPRGTGIVTRRPLVLQLLNIPSSGTEPLETSATVSPEPQNVPYSQQMNGSLSFSSSTASLASQTTQQAQQVQQAQPMEEWGEFLHIPGKRFYDFNEIRREIENETARLAGTNKGISRQPINLKIYSPHVLNLTLVDLPGLTKIPIGDQPTDIEKQTRTLILEYISRPNSIILAVSPANVDLVNSESLKLAAQVDPQGKRTIGVLTKLDLMDHGTNAADILAGKVYPLRLGFIGVVNRSQQDIHVGKSLRESLKSEREFFDNHPVYRNMGFKCGTKFLAKSLNSTLMNHIREKLPDIKAKLNTLMSQTEQELASYGDYQFSGPENRGPLILQLMTRFATNFVSAIEGTSSEVSTDELCGGARIYHIYHEVFGQSLQAINATSSLSTMDIRIAVRNSMGPRPSLFVPELAFDLLVKPQIKLLEPPSQRCVEMVYEELMKICYNCGSPELARYPKLQAKLIEVVSELLRERLGPTSSYVESLISIHRAYINTNHPNFVGPTAAMADILEERKQHKAAAAQAEKLEEVETVKELPESNGSVLGAREDGDASESVSTVDADSVQDVGPTDMERSVSSVSSQATGEHRDSFLNYFFGREKDNAGRQQQQTAMQQMKLSPGSSRANAYNGKSLTNRMGNLELGSSGGEEFSEKEMLECELIRRLIISYFDIVREMIQDQVPKAVMCLLVNYCKESIQNRLVTKLYREELFDELLREDETIAQDRSKCENLLKTYKEAARIISEAL